MKSTQTQQTPAEFFYEHAGFSYDPARETRTQGRRRCAKALAKAERRASEQGWSFEWEVDDIDSSDFSDEKPAWELWVCIAKDAKGEMKASLSGIDFGRDGEPWGDPYRRVVEAELALEGLD